MNLRVREEDRAKFNSWQEIKEVILKADKKGIPVFGINTKREWTDSQWKRHYREYPYLTWDDVDGICGSRGLGINLTQEEFIGKLGLRHNPVGDSKLKHYFI